MMMSTTVDSFNYYLSTFLHSLIPLRTNLNNSRFSLNLFFFGIFWQYSLNLFLWNILTIFSQFVFFMEYFDSIPSISFLWNILTIFPQFVFVEYFDNIPSISFESLNFIMDYFGNGGHNLVWNLRWFTSSVTVTV